MLLHSGGQAVVSALGTPPPILPEGVTLLNRANEGLARVGNICVQLLLVAAGEETVTCRAATLAGPSWHAWLVSRS